MKNSTFFIVISINLLSNVCALNYHDDLQLTQFSEIPHIPTPVPASYEDKSNFMDLFHAAQEELDPGPTPASINTSLTLEDLLGSAK